MSEIERDLDVVSEVLSFLVAQDNYGYVDKIGQAPTPDLLIFYLKEAFRDFHSLLRAPKPDQPNKFYDELNRFYNEIKERKKDLDSALDAIYDWVRRGDRKKLREVCSIISAKALAKSLSLKAEEGGGK